ncbi:MAG: AraC family transcriptional regulator [Rhodobacteraceae bacterium]|nr:AraC family transcriptional regulator [Paracoccaceae bacterium]
MTPAETAILERLNDAMKEGIWREEGLTVGQFARKLETSDHRLRKVINQSMGYRNFAAFINGRRIEAAKAVLSDVQKSDTPILTIAHEVGFASLGPFNRAFREMTGENPTDFRKRNTVSTG